MQELAGSKGTVTAQQLGLSSQQVVGGLEEVDPALNTIVHFNSDYEGQLATILLPTD